jgi:hypothetical protein
MRLVIALLASTTALATPSWAQDALAQQALGLAASTAAKVATSVGGVVYLDAPQFGAVHDGVTDDTPALIAAETYLAAQGGGTIRIGAWSSCYAINTNHTLPSGVNLAGGAWPGLFRVNVNYASVPYCIKHPASVTLGPGQNGRIEKLVIKNSALTTPTTTRQALTMISGFSGTGITNGGHDASLQDVVILGFATCYSTSGWQRSHLANVGGDCTNGSSVDNSHDVAQWSNVEWWEALTPAQAWTTQSWAITAAANNGSGFYRITGTFPGAYTPAVGDLVWLTGIGGASGANGKFSVTAVGANTIDVNAPVSPSITGTTTSGSLEITGLSSMIGVAPGVTVTGTGVAGLSVVAIGKNSAILSNVATASGTVTLTLTNGAYTSGGTANVDTNQRSGVGFTYTNSEYNACIGCYEYGFNIGFLIGTGAGWTNVTSFFADSNIALKDPTSIGIDIEGSAYSSMINGGITSSVGIPLVINSSSGSSHLISNFHFNSMTLTGAAFEAGSAIVSASADTGGSYLIVGQNMTALKFVGVSMPSDVGVFATSAVRNSVQKDGSSQFSASTAPFGITKLNGYTVVVLNSQIPCSASTVGDQAYVTDAAAPTYNATLAGGGAVITQALCNGSAWTAH